MGASALEKKVHCPVITERQVAFRWKISVKTLRRCPLQHVDEHRRRLHLVDLPG